MNDEAKLGSATYDVADAFEAALAGPLVLARCLAVGRGLRGAGVAGVALAAVIDGRQPLADA